MQAGFVTAGNNMNQLSEPGFEQMHLFGARPNPTQCSNPRVDDVQATVRRKSAADVQHLKQSVTTTAVRYVP